MLYESTYNQYFLEHSWGPWKKHLYISRDGESGKYTYKYPKEYYDRYKSDKLSKIKSGFVEGNKTDSRWMKNLRRESYKDIQGKSGEELRRDAEADSYEDEYYDSTLDKVINNSVKAAVNALNFGADMKNKAEGYLNRFANAVADAWNGAKSSDRTRVQAGKKFVSDLWDYTKNTVTAKKISSSIQNLVKGAGELVKKTWDDTKKKAKNAKRAVTETARSAKTGIVNTIKGAKARSQGAVPA